VRDARLAGQLRWGPAFPDAGNSGYVSEIDDVAVPLLLVALGAGEVEHVVRVDVFLIEAIVANRAVRSRVAEDLPNAVAAPARSGEAERRRMTIPAYRLPEGIERGSRFGPTWKNVIQEAISGNEQRFAQWTHCRGVGNVSYGLQNSSDPVGDFNAIVAMWRAHGGSLLPFRFRDWSDYTANDEPFGSGDGTTTAFQICKVYDPSYKLLGLPGTLTYVRNITLLDGTPVIKVNGVVTTALTISSSGMVTFTTAPPAGHSLNWTGNFDVPVRFDTDQLEVVTNEADLTSIRSLPIREVIGEA
jgi:uncharacterized protein (TIGR02217 family)